MRGKRYYECIMGNMNGVEKEEEGEREHKV